MEITLRNAAIALGLVGALSFAAGRFLTPEKVKIQEKIVTVEKTEKSTKTDTDRKKNVVTTKVEETRPDGTKTVTTKTEENTETNRKTLTQEETDKQSTAEREKTIEAGRSRLTVSALAGLDLTDLKKPPVFGAHASKPFLGPITLGVWGLSNATGGLSVGLQF